MIKVNPGEIIKLIQFLDKHGVSEPNDYRFEINPSFKALNLKIELDVTYLPNADKTTIVLDP